MHSGDLIDWPGPTMSMFCYRALHSLYVDALFAANTELRHRVIGLADGMSAGHFMLAIHARRYRVDVRIENDVPWLWVSYWDGQEYAPIVAVEGTAVGADPGLLLKEQSIRLEDELVAILAGDQ